MASSWYSVVLLAVYIGSSSVATAAPRVKLFCYLDGSAQFLTGNGTYGFVNVPADTCDVIVFRGGFFPLTDGSVYFEDPYQFTAFAANGAVRQRSDIFVTIGDPASGALPTARLSSFRSIVADESSRANLVRSIGELVEQYELDGIEIDWQDGLVTDADNLVLFLTELQTSLDFTVPISLAVINDAAYGFDKYSVLETNDLVDYFSVRTFDYVDTDLDITQLGSPFSRQQQDVQLLISNTYGVPRPKIIFNVPLHAFTFRLADAAQHAVGDESLAAGPAGPSTRQKGRMTYRELTDYLDAKGAAATVEYSDYTPYAYSGKDWIAFEDVASVAFKCRFAFMLGINAGLQSISEDQSDANNLGEQLTRACRLASSGPLY